jgi:hypothetical protein
MVRGLASDSEVQPLANTLAVTVTLEDVDLREHIPKRTITLRAPDWQAHIGRGTQSGYGGITAAPDNTWFDSKVMSRSHAVLRADPTTKVRSLSYTCTGLELTQTGHPNRRCRLNAWHSTLWAAASNIPT